MMFFLSFINIKTWHKAGYLFYIIVLILLVWASLYGITVSGSQRWINLHFINFQPSELMKIAIIVCFAKYYHRMQLGNVNKFKNLLIPLVILVLPIALVISQPDLGQTLLVAMIWLTLIFVSGINVYLFFLFFIFVSLIASYLIFFV